MAGSCLYLIKELRVLYKARTAITYRVHGMLNVLRCISEICFCVFVLSTKQAPRVLKLVQNTD
jgi:hypothetical protein